VFQGDGKYCPIGVKLSMKEVRLMRCEGRGDACHRPGRIIGRKMYRTATFKEEVPRRSCYRSACLAVREFHTDRRTMLPAVEMQHFSVEQGGSVRKEEVPRKFEQADFVREEEVQHEVEQA
jgi:hypothetical protein